MSFINRMTPKRTPQDVVAAGGVATAPGNDYNALRVARPATKSIPLNAPAQNYRAGMPGNKNVTPIQAMFVTAIARRKINSKSNTGSASWIGKLFG